METPATKTEEFEVLTFHPTYNNPGLARKLFEVKCFRREHSFNQTELALLEHVTHQRISAMLKNLSRKATVILKSREEQLELLLDQFKTS